MCQSRHKLPQWKIYSREHYLGWAEHQEKVPSIPCIFQFESWHRRWNCIHKFHFHLYISDRDTLMFAGNESKRIAVYV